MDNSICTVLKNSKLNALPPLLLKPSFVAFRRFHNRVRVSDPISNIILRLGLGIGQHGAHAVMLACVQHASQ